MFIDNFNYSILGTNEHQRIVFIHGLMAFGGNWRRIATALENEDSFRRDFTINALYYDPIDEKLVDRCGGLKDIHRAILKMIGDPKKRIEEDPIRILRGLRLSHKLGFTTEHELRKAIFENASLLQKSVLPRRREEWLKIFKLDKLETLLFELYDLHILQNSLSTLEEIFKDEVKAQEFLFYLERGQGYADKQSPLEIFAVVVVSYIMVLFGDHQKLIESDIFNDSKFIVFCREELGLHKTEFATIQMALQLWPQLKKKESFLKKGLRRKQSFLSHQALELSLKLGYATNFISSGELIFWETQRQLLDRPQ